PWAPLPPVAVPTGPVKLPGDAELMRLAVENRPEVKLAADAIHEADAKLALARRDANPELAVWAGYMVNIRGVDTFTTGESTTTSTMSGISSSTRSAWPSSSWRSVSTFRGRRGDAHRVHARRVRCADRELQARGGEARAVDLPDAPAICLRQAGRLSDLRHEA